MVVVGENVGVSSVEKFFQPIHTPAGRSSSNLRQVPVVTGGVGVSARVQDHLDPAIVVNTSR